MCKTRTCVRTCDGWPNGFASRLTSSRNLQKVVSFTHIPLTCDQLASTSDGRPNGEKLASTGERIWAPPKSTQLIASPREWVAKRNGVERKSKNSVDLRVRLARALALLVSKKWYWGFRFAPIRLQRTRSMGMTPEYTKIKPFLLSPLSAASWCELAPCQTSAPWQPLLGTWCLATPLPLWIRAQWVAKEGMPKQWTYSADNWTHHW